MTSLRQAIAGLRNAASARPATTGQRPHVERAAEDEGEGSDREQIEKTINEDGWHQRPGLEPGSDADGEYVGYINAAGDRRARVYYRHRTELAWAAWNEAGEAADPARRAGWMPDLKAGLLDYIHGGRPVFKAAS